MNGNIKLGQKAPDFTADSTFGKINLSDYSGKWLVFFSHPGDFTPVCTTEMIAFARAYPFFQKLNTNLLGLSIDSNASHLAWVNEIYNLTGVSLPFPIIADRNGSIARLYGMISNEMFGGDIIRVSVNGYLKNNTDGENTVFKEKGIRTKDKLSFVFDDVKYSIKINDNDIMLVRDGNDFINSFSFSEKSGKSNYYLKEHGFSIDMDVNVDVLVIDDNKIFIKYVIAQTGCEYELMIEMEGVL